MLNTKIHSNVAILVVALLLTRQCSGFHTVSLHPRGKHFVRRSTVLQKHSSKAMPMPKTKVSKKHASWTPTLPYGHSPHFQSALHMGYLPPEGGGGSKDSLVSNIITPVLTVAATILFFLSPLGAVFFAVTNSIFLGLLLLPLILSIGFQAWQYFYTISAPCPNCGAPTRVLKDDQVGPNICLNCGSLIRANLAKDGVELCNDPNDLFDESSRVSSFFDLFTRNMDSSDTGDDIGGVFFEETTTATTTRKTRESRQDKERRERTIIDVDATKDD